MRNLLLLLVSVFAVACAAPGATEPGSAGLTFVHLNDTYRVGDVEDGKAGGFGRVVTVIRDLQAAGVS